MNRVALAVLALIGALFVLKYGGRGSGVSLLLAIGYGAVFFIAASKLISLPSRSGRWQNRSFYRTTAIGAALGLAGMLWLLPDASRVGRLPAINEWLAALLAGRFPYHASTLPSGFPVLFLLALPGYLVHNVGLLEALGFLLFAWAALLLVTNDLQVPWERLAILLLLPSFWYEIVVRSELFFNMALCATVIILADRVLSKDPRWSRFVAFGVAFGCLLSTRAIVAVPMTVAFFSLLSRRTAGPKGSARSLYFLLAAVALFVFLSSLIPFLIWNPGEFVHDGPFAAQLRYLPGWVQACAVGVAAFAGWRAASIQRVLMISGILLLLLTLSAFVPKLLSEGLSGVLQKDKFDISYFVLCTPFLLLSLKGSLPPAT